MSVPSAPQIFKRPDARNNQLTFFWDPPASDGGSPITSYLLSNASTTYTIPSNTNFYKLTNLTNGSNYSFSLAASNANGLGSFNSFRTVQPGFIPDPPTNPSYTSIGNHKYSVSWANPINTGDAALRGTVLTAIPVDSNDNLVLTNSNAFIRKSVIGGGSTTGFISLNSSNNWKVGIRAVNDPGYSSDTVYTSTIITSGGGSLVFDGNSTTWLSVANDIDFRFRTGDFTVEWFQYQTSAGSFPRVFSIGTYSSASIAVSIEGGNFYLWMSGASVFYTPVTLLNEWVHFAITRSSNSVRVFRNGTQIGSTFPNNYDLNDSINALTIGNETTKTSSAAFYGRITNFHWVKGTALYTSNFPIPTSPLTPVANSKLLLLASDSGTATIDSSGAGKTVTNNANNVTWSNSTPF